MMSGLLEKVRSGLASLPWNARSDRQLVELHAHAPILPVLTRQLKDATQDMESEVSKVCQNFHGMATKAKSTVQNASQILDSDASGGNDIAAVIVTCRQTMLTLLDRMGRGGELSQRAIQRMEHVEASVGQVTKVLREVDQAAFANKIIALNAKIEAVHLGDAGKGFEVVAEEISAQAESSTKLTVEVSSILDRLVGAAREAVSELREMSAADRQWIESSRKDIHRTLADLEQANKGLRDSLQSASEQSSQLASDIEAALMTLQFQDRVNQRIQHVVESLESMHHAISSSEPAAEAGDLEERRKEVAGKLAASYTMSSERFAHADPAGDSGKDDAGDVELF